MRIVEMAWYAFVALGLVMVQWWFLVALVLQKWAISTALQIFLLALVCSK